MKKQLHPLQRWQRQLSEQERSIRLQMLIRSKRTQRTKQPSKMTSKRQNKLHQKPKSKCGIELCTTGF